MSHDSPMATFPEITVKQLHAMMQAGARFQLIDVREPNEFAICRIPGSVLIPLNELPGRLQEIDPEIPTVVHCKLGGRSFQAMHFLKQCGFGAVANLAGGIVAWAEQIDPSLARYW